MIVGHPLRRSIRWLVVAGAAVLTVIALTLSGLGTSSVGGRATAVAPEITDSVVDFTSDELARWRQSTASPQQRAQVIAQLTESFAGVAQVGYGTAPRAAGSSPSGVGFQQILATGISGDHFWITASYADIARGAVPGAVAACAVRLPRALCNAAGNLLKSMAAGWGTGNSHGIWAAVYWWPPRVTAGRW